MFNKQILCFTILCFVACTLCTSSQQVPIWSQVGCNTAKGAQPPEMCWTNPTLDEWKDIGNLGIYPYTNPSYSWTSAWPGLQSGTKVNITDLIGGVTYEIRTCNSQITLDLEEEFYYTMSFVQYKRDGSGADLAEVPPCCGEFNHAAFVHDATTYYNFVEVSINLVVQTEGFQCLDRNQVISMQSKGSGQVNLEIRIQNCPTCNVELAQNDPPFELHYYALTQTVPVETIPSTFVDQLVPQNTCEYNCASYPVTYSFSPNQFSCQDAYNYFQSSQLKALTLIGKNNQYTNLVPNDTATCNINVQVFDSTNAQISCNQDDTKWYVVSKCTTAITTIPQNLVIDLANLCTLSGTEFCDNYPNIATCFDNCCNVEGSPSCNTAVAVSGTWNWKQVSTFDFSLRQWQLPGRDGAYNDQETNKPEIVTQNCFYNLGLIKAWYQNNPNVPEKVSLYSEIVIHFFSNIPSIIGDVSSPPQTIFGVYLIDAQIETGTLIYQSTIQRNEADRQQLTRAIVKLGSSNLKITTDPQNPYVYYLVLRAENSANSNIISAAPWIQLYFA